MGDTCRTRCHLGRGATPDGSSGALLLLGGRRLGRRRIALLIVGVGARLQHGDHLAGVQHPALGRAFQGLCAPCDTVW
jgi:hypothetical protein